MTYDESKSAIGLMLAVSEYSLSADYTQAVEKSIAAEYLQVCWLQNKMSLQHWNEIHGSERMEWIHKQISHLGVSMAQHLKQLAEGS